MIRAIPFSKASAGVTLSINQLADFSKWPETIRDPRFKAEVEAVTAAVRKEKAEDEAEALTPETIRNLEDAIEALRLKVVSVYPTTTFEGRQLRPFLRGLAGLARMLEMPDMQTLLLNVDAAPERSIADLIQFMSAFQLRFGRAQTPEQRLAYTQLFPLLDSLRKAVQGKAPATGPAPPPEKFMAVMTEVLGNVPEASTVPGAPLPPVPAARATEPKK
jgi:hypothetical protein